MMLASAVDPGYSANTHENMLKPWITRNPGRLKVLW
jgi:hypothetical protein